MARLAVAAILIFEATNKMNMVSGATNCTVTLATLIFNPQDEIAGYSNHFLHCRRS